MRNLSPSPQFSADAPIRITYLITASGVGGAEKILLNLVTRLDHNRFRANVITLKPLGLTAEKIQAAGIPVTSLHLPAETGPPYFLKLPPAAVRLVKLFRQEKPAILHAWLFQANLLGRLAAALAGVPVVISSLRVQEMEKNFQAPLDRLTRGLVTLYVTNARALAEHYRRRLGVGEDRIVVIPNGIETSAFSARDDRSLRRELGIGAQAPVIGVLGRLHRQKGQDLLLRALPEISARFPDLVILLAGDGPMRAELERSAADFAQRVRFLGEWDRVPEFLAALDLLVLPSRWEGMPNVVLEAMAAGRPVVAAAVGGVPELVVSGRELKPIPAETGVLVSAENPEMLAQAVIALLADPRRRASMGEAGRARAAEFSLEKMVAAYSTLYENLLCRKAGERRQPGFSAPEIKL